VVRPGLQRVADSDPSGFLFTKKGITEVPKPDDGSELPFHASVHRDYRPPELSFRIKTRGINTPNCECGEGREIVERLVM